MIAPVVAPGLRRLGTEQGSTLIEVIIASAIMVTLMAGLMGLGAVALATTENQGHLAARTSEYAQDKMEQLLALAYTDATSDTCVFPAAATGGTGLNEGGSFDPATVAAKYVDYLDSSGNLLVSSGTTAPTGWFYKRVWRVEIVSTNLKQITVTVTVSRGFGGAMASRSVLRVLKSSPF